MNNKQNNIDRTRLATELANLENAEYQFDSLVTQFIAAQRDMSTANVVGNTKARPDEIERSLSTMESGLEKLDNNLRAQYPEFLETYIKFRADTYTNEELNAFVKTLKEEHVRRYLTRTKEVQQEFTQVTKKLVDRLLRVALGRMS